MTRNLRVFGTSLAIALIGLANLGGRTPPPALEARGPGATFRNVDNAAVDALTYAYLEGVAAHDTKRMRGGTIHWVQGGFSYDKILKAGPLAPFRVRVPLQERDVAWFLIYYRTGRYDVDRTNERPSLPVRIQWKKDPLHRPLYILHPSLVIRVYRGENGKLGDGTDLRQISP